MKLLANKTAIITGASRGIGSGIAKTFVEHGCAVAFTYSSNQAAADALVAELEGSGVKVKAYQSNAAHFDEAQKLVDEVLNDFGGLDILVNNAGITKDKPFHKMTPDDWNAVINATPRSFRIYLHELANKYL